MSGGRSVYLQFEPRKLATSLALALILVPALAVAAKAVVESLTPYTYEIHWLETVPVLILGFTLFINGELNRRGWLAAAP